VGTPTGGTPQGDELQEVTVTVTTRRIPVVCLSPAGAGPNPVERRVGIATGGIPIYVYEPRPDAIFLFVSTTAFVMLTLPFTTQAFAICKGRDEKWIEPWSKLISHRLSDTLPKGNDISVISARSLSVLNGPATTHQVPENCCGCSRTRKRRTSQTGTAFALS
jgi:hypothetical protein